MSQTVYRALRGNAPEPYDFESQAERKSFPHKTGDCDDWGLSTWISMDAVQLARNIVPGFRKKCIVSFEADTTDGVLLHTKTIPQPDHHTFWKANGKNFCEKCNVEIARGSA